MPSLTVILGEYFYPRPPGGGRQQFDYPVYIDLEISIHALRVEGDGGGTSLCRPPITISIHALRVEGDRFKR